MIGSFVMHQKASIWTWTKAFILEVKADPSLTFISPRIRDYKLRLGGKSKRISRRSYTIGFAANGANAVHLFELRKQ